jgi:hypothetical protein
MPDCDGQRRDPERSETLLNHADTIVEVDGKNATYFILVI